MDESLDGTGYLAFTAFGKNSWFRNVLRPDRLPPHGPHAQVEEDHATLFFVPNRE